MKGIRRVLQVFAGLVVGAVFAWFAVRNVDWAEISRILDKADYTWLVASIFFLVLHYVVKAWRWRILLAVRAEVPFGLTFRAMSVGFLMSNLVPVRIGELASRPYLLAANCPSVPFGFALSSVLGVKVLDLLFVGLLLLASAVLYNLPGGWIWTAVWLTGAAIFVGVASLVMAFRWSGPALQSRLRGLFSRVLKPDRADRLSTYITRFSEGVAALGSGPALLKAFFLTAVSLAILYIAILCTARVLALPLGPAPGIVILALMGVGFALPAPPTYAGNLHYFITRAVVLTGLASEELGLSLAILIHATEVLVVCSLGVLSLPGLRWKGGSPDAKAEAPESGETG